VQLPGLRVEVERGDADGEEEVDALRGDGARVGFEGDAPDGTGTEDVLGFDEVVGVPLEGRG
jgi:hypothetical protein